MRIPKLVSPSQEIRYLEQTNSLCLFVTAGSLTFDLLFKCEVVLPHHQMLQSGSQDMCIALKSARAIHKNRENKGLWEGTLGLV